MERARQVEAVQALVERIDYNGANRQISIRFRQPAPSDASAEVLA
jgi:hypothetical protein